MTCIKPLLLPGEHPKCSATEKDVFGVTTYLISMGVEPAIFEIVFLESHSPDRYPGWDSAQCTIWRSGF
jgi:hypothetical protein